MSHLITIADALRMFDEAAEAYLQSLDNFPSLTTDDPRERERIAQIIAPDRKRLTERWAELREELRTGKPAHRSKEED